MFTVYEASGVHSRIARRTFETFEAACDYVRSLNPICFELDADNPGCADAYLPGGRVYMIELGRAA